MTESDWLTSSSPIDMLNWYISRVHVPHKGVILSWSTKEFKVSKRKLRLFGVACCRQLWEPSECYTCNGSGQGKLISSEGHASRGISKFNACRTCKGVGSVSGIRGPIDRESVEISERFADGEATQEDLERAWNTTTPWTPQSLVCWDDPVEVARSFASGVDQQVASMSISPLPKVEIRIALLRDILGNPAKLELRWHEGQLCEINYEDHCNSLSLTEYLSSVEWFTPTIQALAKTIYEERAFDQMYRIADELEQVGCTNEEVLSHCRCSSNLHARGCWVIDSFLGKE